MKLEVTKKFVRKQCKNILAIGYGGGVDLLRFQTPFAYSAGTYGWSCDYYLVDDVVLSAGYFPVKSINMKCHEILLTKLNNKARDIFIDGNIDAPTKEMLTNALLSDFCKACKI